MRGELMLDQFPWYQHHPQACYFDSAASCQVPAKVLERVRYYYEVEHANVHRSSHQIGRHATSLLEQARADIAAFCGVQATDLSLQTSTTQALNDLAQALPVQWQAGDEILLSAAEHHANLLPWQFLAEQHQLKLRVISIDPQSGQLGAWHNLLNERTRVVAMTAASNISGQVFALTGLLEAARECGAYTIVDAAQVAAHGPLSDYTKLADAVIFSGHKMYGIAGAAAIAMQPSFWTQLEPWTLGGGMVTQVSHERSLWVDSIHRFEAGTPNTAAILAFQAAAQWLQQHAFVHDELQLMREYLIAQLKLRDDIVILPSSDRTTPTFSFYHQQIHAHDIATWLDQQQIYVRAGHHCAQPFLAHLGLAAVVRVSLGAYTTRPQIERFLASLDQGLELFA